MVLTGIKLEDLHSPSLAVRLKANQILARNEHMIYGKISPKMAEVLRHLEEEQKALASNILDSGAPST